MIIDWSVVFDGAGSSIISAALGAVVTAVVAVPVSYKAGRRSMRQSQKAGGEAKQVQIGSIKDSDE